MSMRPDQGVAADAGGMVMAAPDHRLVHDDDLLAEFHPAALGGHHRTKQDPAVLPDDHVAADHRVGRHIGRRGQLWPSSLVLDEHYPPSPQRHPPRARRVRASVRARRSGSGVRARRGAASTTWTAAWVSVCQAACAATGLAPVRVPDPAADQLATQPQRCRGAALVAGPGPFGDQGVGWSPRPWAAQARPRAAAPSRPGGDGRGRSR
jgi:hypothetical protein